MGTAEVESALVAHPQVSEAAVVGYPHDIKGQGIYAYVTLMTGVERDRGPAQGPGRLGAQGDRPDRFARPDPVRARLAQDPLRQDHAPDPAQDRGERVSARWATHRRWPIPPWSTSSSTTGRTAARIDDKLRFSSGPLPSLGRQDAISNSWADSILVARMTAWVRLSTPSFCRIADTCALTVASETLSS